MLVDGDGNSPRGNSPVTTEALITDLVYVFMRLWCLDSGSLLLIEVKPDNLVQKKVLIKVLRQVSRCGDW